MTNQPSPVSPPDLYCITDPTLSPLPVEEQMQQMIEGGCRLIQLRHKSATDGEFRLMAQKCLTICHWGNATFIVNDRVDIAAEVGADGVHLGQDDVSPRRARQLLGDEKVIGISTHNRQQFDLAMAEDVDYIALGPIFGTTTKANPDPAVGLELVEYAAFELEGDHRPLVLIGGINLERLPLLKSIAPRAFIVAMGAVLSDRNIAGRVKEFRAAIKAR